MATPTAHGRVVKISQQKGSPCGSKDFLPHQIKSTRILTYEYSSAILGPDTAVSSVKDIAHDLLQRITDDRSDSKVRPCT